MMRENMKSDDLATELTKRLSAILEDCKRIEPAVAAYLKETDERPVIHAELLRVLSHSLAAYELIVPDHASGEFHGLPPEVCGRKVDSVSARHTERDPGWDFGPWLAEKLNALQKAAKGLVKEWLRDLSSVELRKDAPMTPREYLRSGIQLQFAELRQKALTVFEEVCSDRLQLEEDGQQRRP
jgi:hypothetical protein